MLAYRVIIFTGENGSPARHACAHIHYSARGAAKCAADARKAGHGAGVQFRLMSGEPWRWLNPDQEPK